MEDFEKKYNDALENIKTIKKANKDNKELVEFIEFKYPELKESEDERIMKELIEQVIYIVPNDDEVDNEGNVLPTYQKRIDKYRAWLEKQGEHANFRHNIQIGDRVTRNEDGVLVNLSQLNRVAEPAEKQRKKKPIEWSADDLLKCNQIITILKEYNRTDLIAWLEKIEIIWLKFLKERVQPNPKQEWSEEDKKLIDDTCHLINTLASGYGENVTEPITLSGTQMIASIKDRLRALVDNRPQSTWKPSDEQIEAVRIAAEIGTANNSWAMGVLKSMYQDLKKLRG